MPSRPKTPCRHPGCPALVDDRYCEAHAPQHMWGGRDKRSAHRRGYGVQHRRMRALVLLEEPLCRECLKVGGVSASVIADHIKPKAEGGSDDRSNYQGLCQGCSDVKTAREGKRGQGWPGAAAAREG